MTTSRFNISRFVASFICVIGCLLSTRFALAQNEPRPALADRIRDHSEWIFVLNDLAVVRADIDRLAKDLGFGAVDFSSFINPGSAYGVEPAAGAAFYSERRGGFAFVTELAIADFQLLEQEYEFTKVADSRIDLRKAKIGGDFPFQMMELISGRESVAFSVANRLLFCPAGEEDRAMAVMDAPSLAARLDDEARDIINLSGATAIEPRSTEVFGLYGNDDIDLAGCSEAERKWAEELLSTTSAADLALIGLKYHENVLELRARVLINHERSYSPLFNLSETGESWSPDLGIEPDNLVGALAIRLNAFNSSAGPRAIPRTLLQNFGELNSLRFLQGDMLNMVMELSGDSWNELDVARIALYENGNSREFGKLSVIGIADAREPEQVIQELRRLSIITSPMNVAEKTDRLSEEIKRLVEQLGSRDIGIAERAATRLALAGQAALKAVEQAANSTDVQTRDRAQRTLARIRKGIARNKNPAPVADPLFWTTLNPGLELIESVDSINDFVVHRIRITPDPAKTEEEVRDAVMAMTEMFGPEWDSISVAQVNDHFVFMIGSDRELLQSAITSVAAGICSLAGQFNGIGNSRKAGPLQVFVVPARLARIVGQLRSGDHENPDKHVSWAIFDVDKYALSVDVLVPVEQIRPFLFGF